MLQVYSEPKQGKKKAPDWRQLFAHRNNFVLEVIVNECNLTTLLFFKRIPQKSSQLFTLKGTFQSSFNFVFKTLTVFQATLVACHLKLSNLKECIIYKSLLILANYVEYKIIDINLSYYKMFLFKVLDINLFYAVTDSNG